MKAPCERSLIERVRVNGKFFARGLERLRLKGVTYGPFAPGSDGQQFPDAATLRTDLSQMIANGIHGLRTHHRPAPRLLDLADEYGMNVLMDVPWPKHVCFLESRTARREARRAVRAAAELGRGHACAMAYSVANEISP